MNMPERYNFIVASLCDNDFSHVLRDGLVSGFDDYGYGDKLCPNLWKKFLIAYILGEELKRVLPYHSMEFDWGGIQNTEDYLRGELTVTFERLMPDKDDDNGSACIDIHTLTAWTY